MLEATEEGPTEAKAQQPLLTIPYGGLGFKGMYLQIINSYIGSRSLRTIPTLGSLDSLGI